MFIYGGEGQVGCDEHPRVSEYIPFSFSPCLAKKDGDGIFPCNELEKLRNVRPVSNLCANGCKKARLRITYTDAVQTEHFRTRRKGEDAYAFPRSFFVPRDSPQRCRKGGVTWTMTSCHVASLNRVKPNFDRFFVDRPCYQEKINEGTFVCPQPIPFLQEERWNQEPDPVLIHEPEYGSRHIPAKYWFLQVGAPHRGYDFLHRPSFPRKLTLRNLNKAESVGTSIVADQTDYLSPLTPPCH